MVEHARVGRGRRPRRGTDRILVDEDHLVDAIQPLEGVELTRLLPGRMQPPRECPPEHLEHERGFSRAARAGHGREHAQRKPDVDPAERAVADAAEFEPPGGLPAALLRLPCQHRVAGPAVGEIRPRHARLDRFQLRRRGLGHDPTPLATAPRAKVERVVGRGDDVAVVLHHHHRIAEVAELAEGRDQAVRVAWMQADRRLVEHVEHAGEAAADLGRQPDPLQLAAGEAAGRPGHVEILQAHIHQKRHPGVEFTEQVAGDLSIGIVERDGGEFLVEPTQGHPPPDIQRPAPERDGAGHVGEPAAAALAARHLVHHGVDLAAEGDDEPGRLLAGRFEALELKGEPGRRGAARPRSPGLAPLGFFGEWHVDPFFARALEEHPLLDAGEVGERHVDRQAGRPAEGLEHRPADPPALGTVERGPEIERGFPERKRCIADERLAVDARARAEAIAARAPAQRAVERELPGL